MLGAIIGDIAANQWQINKERFYKELITDEAKPSLFGEAVLKLSGPVLNDEEIKSHVFDLIPYNQMQVIGVIIAGIQGWRTWMAPSVVMPDSCKWLKDDKEEIYATAIMLQAIQKLRSGATKDSIFNGKYFFSVLKTWNTHNDGILGDVVRAWRCFYYAYDFTSSIHNAVKCDIRPQITSLFAGFFAEAMYGCRYNLIKKKYLAPQEDQSSFCRRIVLPKSVREEFASQLNYVTDYLDEHSLFFGKNMCRTNVEQHKWLNIINFYHKVKISEIQKSKIFMAHKYDDGNPYSIYLDNGWLYLYHDNVVLCRFQLLKKDKGYYLIDNIQKSNVEQRFLVKLFEELKILGVKPSFKNKSIYDCKYYQGEVKVPNGWDPMFWKARLWHGEHMFILGDFDIKRLKEYAIEHFMKLKGPRKKAIEKLTSNQLAILDYMFGLYTTWCPMENPDWLFSYGLDKLPSFPITNNTSAQKRADDCARQNGYFCASYLGHDGENLVYSPQRKESIHLDEGLPAVIVVHYAYTSFYQEESSFKILENVKYRTSCKGKKIYEDMLSKLNDPSTSVSEKKYILSLKRTLSENDLKSKAIDVDLYIYLEIAERFNMKLKVCKNEDYYYELTE